MDLMTILVFLCSLTFFIKTFQSFLQMQKKGVYPPKKKLRKQMELFAISGTILFLLGLILSFMND